ncbi:MAG: hypothetical protein WCX47_04910 [Bacilli bacterium]|nr:hypothetical protein [Bacilli bacterium]MDD4344460.1 hypothetical protein [Bacilli bacterium]MDD4520636.1 hypothetical protein [Bacilli bacterium]
MKKALRDKRVLLVLGALILGALLISFLPWVIINYTPWFPEASINQQYPAIMLYFFAIVFFLVGYLVGDIFEARDRKKSGNYSGRLDDKTRAKKWLFRTAPYLAALFCLIAGLITDLAILTYLA